MLFKKIAGLSCEFLIDNLKPLIEVSGGRAFFAVGRQDPFIKCLQRHLINAADGQGAAGSYRSWLVYAIVICNFFLVSLVLINLLIAMMSSTYDNINKQAKSDWNHCRASIITNLDKVPGPPVAAHAGTMREAVCLR